MARIVIKATDKGPAAEYILNMKDGMPYLKRRIHSTMDASPEQKRGILIFMSLTGAWRTLPAAIKKEWGEKEEDGEAQFMNENTALLEQGKPMKICRCDELNSPSIRTCPSNTGEIVLVYDAVPPARYVTVFAQTHGRHGAFAFEEIITAVSGSPVVMEGLAPGKDITLHCVISDKPMAQSGRISASQAIKVTVK